MTHRDPKPENVIDRIPDPHTFVASLGEEVEVTATFESDFDLGVIDSVLVVTDEVRDLRARLSLLRSALRPGPLTDASGPTAEGHIVSAVTKLERRLEEMRLGR